MAKLNPLLAAVGVAAGSMIVLGALPSTRWVLADQFRALITRHPTGDPYVEFSTGNIGELWRASPAPANLKADEWAWLLPTARVSVEDVGPNERTTKFLEAHAAKYPDDPVVQGVLARNLCRYVQWGSAVRQPTQLQVEAARTLIEVCERGEKADPDNAFFPVLKAAMLEALGELERPKEFFLRASLLDRFDDFSRDESEAVIRTAEARFGFGGNRFRLEASSVGLHHLPLVRELLREILRANPGDTELRLAVIRQQYVLAKTTDAPADIMLARSGLTLATVPPDRLKPGSSYNAKDREQWSRDFLYDLRTKGDARKAEWAQEAFDRVEEARRATFVVTSGLDTTFSELFLNKTWHPSRMAAVLFLSVFAALVVVAWTRKRMPTRASGPVLGAIAVLGGLVRLLAELLMNAELSMTLPWLILLAVLVAFLLFLDRLRARDPQAPLPPWWIAGIAVVLFIPVLVIPENFYIAGGAMLAGVGLLLLVLYSNRPFLYWVLAILGLAVLALLTFFGATPEFLSIVPGTLLVAYVLLLVPARTRPAAASTLIFASLAVYWVAVGIELQRDSAAANLLRAWQAEPEQIKSASGLDKPLPL
ncbi:MAG: hypothetical protein EDM74_06505 [Armatimonadetes bacterium]|nr:MAG: hypothetical protein EDM74_06505 [Armatimonadota bacterium]